MSKKPVKIVTIGGGSSYTPELMEGFIKRYDELPIKEIWLVDIEAGIQLPHRQENGHQLPPAAKHPAVTGLCFCERKA